MLTRSGSSVVCAASVVLALVCSPCEARDVSGTVKDIRKRHGSSTFTGIKDVEVRATDGGNVLRSTLTDEHGKYRLAGLPERELLLEFELEGYQDRRAKRRVDQEEDALDVLMVSEGPLDQELRNNIEFIRNSEPELMDLLDKVEFIESMGDFRVDPEVDELDIDALDAIRLPAGGVERNPQELAQ